MCGGKADKNESRMNQFHIDCSSIQRFNRECGYATFLDAYDWTLVEAVRRIERVIQDEWEANGVILPHEFVSNHFNISNYLKHHLQCETQPCFGCYIGEWTLICEHAIHCGWGACYNTLFTYFILPTFNSPALLDAILRSRIVLEKPNVMIGRTGAKAFRQLLDKIQECESESTKLYVVQEFYSHWFEKVNTTSLIR